MSHFPHISGRLRATLLLAVVGAFAAVLVFQATGAASAAGPGQVRPSQPTCPPEPIGTPTTVNQMLVYAANTESAAFLQYNAYADGADTNGPKGETDVGNVWRTVAEVEHQDHWTHEVTLASIYSGSDNVANLQTAIDQAQQAAANFDQYSQCVPAGSKAQKLLNSVSAEERSNASLLGQALTAVQTGGTIPEAPRFKSENVKVTPRPRYSGDAYTVLTGGINSALADSAWLWAEYQFMAKTAVDTGNAHLAALLSGLEGEEAQSNWVQVSNEAGYVNDVKSNLQASIQSEIGAQQMYTGFANQAMALGDTATAQIFESIRGDEAGHQHTFTTEYDGS